MTDQTPFGLTRTPENKETIEILETIKETCTANPRIARETLRILAENENQPSTALASATPNSPVIEVRPPAPQSRSRRKPSRKCTRSKRSHRKRLTRLELHQAHCCICDASDQEEIEEAFVNWECVAQIAQEYNIERRAIYRHAHATGLFAMRDSNIRGALGHIIQRAGRVETTADSVIRAVKMFAHMNPRGEWFNPPTHVIVSPGVPQRSVTPRKVFKDLKP